MCVVQVTDPFSINAKAKSKLPRMIYDFIAGGTGMELAESANAQGFAGVVLQPRVLRNVESINLDTQLLGRTWQRPYGIAPMGMCNIVCPSADQQLSKQAAKRKIPHCVSTAASTTLEDTIKQSEGNCWFQLYAGTNQAMTDELIDRAEIAGYEVLVFTVDTPRHSRRVRDLNNGFSVPLKWGPKQLVDFATHPGWSLSMLAAGGPEPMNYKTSKVENSFERYDSRGASDWVFFDNLRKRWKGKLVVKGVTSCDDAIRLRDSGCDAIYVSNHGGRQLDRGLSAIKALPEIRAVVGRNCPLIFDSGIRCADDIVSALALGASFVMLGRPLLYALAAGGARGLEQYFGFMDEDLKSVMAQIGETAIPNIDPVNLANFGELYSG